MYKIELTSNCALPLGFEKKQSESRDSSCLEQHVAQAVSGLNRGSRVAEFRREFRHCLVRKNLAYVNTKRVGGFNGRTVSVGFLA